MRKYINQNWISKNIAFVGAILGLVGLVYKQGSSVYGFFSIKTTESWTIILCSLNILTLIAFYLILSKPHKLYFKTFNEKGEKEKNYGENKYSNLLHVMSEGKIEGVSKAKWYNERVNILTSQLQTNIIWYCLFLIPVYSFFIFDTEQHPHPLHKYFKIAEDVFNYMSSIFIYLSFLVLYNETLDKRNKPNYFKNRFFIFSMIFTIAYFILYICFWQANPDSTTSKRFSLIAGMMNGLVMSLLFSRYISLEHFSQNIKEVNYPKFVTMGTIYVLPIYAVVQPLFGAFHISEFGNPEKFANFVFGFCLIGKIFFLYLTWMFIKKKLLHLHLHTLITPHDVPMGYERCFNLESDDDEDDYYDE